MLKKSQSAKCSPRKQPFLSIVQCPKHGRNTRAACKDLLPCTSEGTFHTQHQKKKKKYINLVKDLFRSSRKKKTKYCQSIFSYWA